MTAADELRDRLGYSVPSDWLTDDFHYALSLAVIAAVRQLPTHLLVELLGERIEYVGEQRPPFTQRDLRGYASHPSCRPVYAITDPTDEEQG